MKPARLIALTLSLPLLVAYAAAASADAGLYSCKKADGSTAIVQVPLKGAKCSPLHDPHAASTPPAAASGINPSGQAGGSHQYSTYHDMMTADVTPGGSPVPEGPLSNRSKRYKQMDKATFQKLYPPPK